MSNQVENKEQSVTLPTTTKEVVKKQTSPEEIIPDIDIQGAMEAMEEAMMKLVFHQPFFAHVILNLRRIFTTKFPTMAVNVTDQVNLWINPYFLMSLTVDERVDVLCHEVYHVVHNHFTRFKDLEPQIYDSEDKSIIDRIKNMQDASTLNVSADLAINEFLPNLPKKMKFFDKNGKMALEPETIKDKDGNDIPNPNAGKPMEGEPCLVNNLKKKVPGVKNRENMEYYYEILKQEQEKNDGGKVQVGIVIDDHSAWHENEGTDEQVKALLKDVVNKAYESSKEAGNIHADMLKAIHDLNHVPRDWRSDIQKFVSRAMEVLIESTRKKRNRRYGILHPGTKVYPQLHLTIINDESGSVGDIEQAQFHAEMCRIHELGVKLTVVNCDVKVNKVYEFDPKKPFERTACGGTCLKPAFDYVRDELDTDGIVVMSDGGLFDEKIEIPTVPVLWGLTSPFQLPDHIKFGGRVKIEVLKKVNR